VAGLDAESSRSFSGSTARLDHRAEAVAKKISVGADGIAKAEKAATSADNFALRIHNGTGGSNPPLSAKQSALTEIFRGRYFCSDTLVGIAAVLHSRAYLESVTPSASFIATRKGL
jgi:hypothetical protein